MMRRTKWVSFSITGLTILTLAGCGRVGLHAAHPSPTPEKVVGAQARSGPSSAVGVSAVNPPTNSTRADSPSRPSAFQTVQDVWTHMGPYLAAHTSVPVWIPTMTGIPNFSPEPWMDVQYKVAQMGYQLTVSVGPKLPANSPKIISGNAETIYSITALPKNEAVPQGVNWDNASAAIPNAKTQSVHLVHGILGIMYTGKLDGINRRDIVWTENGWTFGWEDEVFAETSGQTIQQADYFASQALHMKLPVASGNFLAGMGSSAPSEVEFIFGNTRYILYAPGGRALQIMNTMRQVR